MFYVIIRCRDFACLLKEPFCSGSFGTSLELVGGCGVGRRRLCPRCDGVSGQTSFPGEVGWPAPSRAERARVGQLPGRPPGPPPCPGGPKPPSALVLQLFPNPKHDSRPRPIRGISENESRGIRLCFGEAPPFPPLGAAGKRSWEHRHHIPPG